MFPKTNLLLIIVFTAIIAFLLLSKESKNENNNITAKIDSGESAQPNQSSIKAPAKKSKDLSTPSETRFRSLDEIRESGYITALKLEWETDDKLPRSGGNSHYHRELVKYFSDLGGIEVRWIRAKNLEEMIELLSSYKADFIPRHLTITEQRKNKLAFTYPLSRDKEVVIANINTPDISSNDKITVSLPLGSAYYETVQNRYKHWNIDPITKSQSSDDLADALVSGKYKYSVIDKSEFDALNKYRDDLKVVMTIPKTIEQAWAVHKDNEALLYRLNEIISYHHMNEISEPVRQLDFLQIKKKKLPLRVITRNSPETYFIWRGELLGFEYELMKKFSTVYDVKLEIIVAETYEEMLEMLKNGEGDVIAAGLTRTAERLNNYKHQRLTSSIRYNRVSEQLVAHKDSPPITKLSDLSGRDITVRKSSSFWQTAQNLSKDYGVKINQADEATSTDILIKGVAEKDIDLTIADSNLLAIEKHFREQITTPLTLNTGVAHSYIVRKNNPKLLEYLNQFIRVHYRKTFYNVVKNKYFTPAGKNTAKIEERLRSGSELSPYDDLVRKTVVPYNFDWRLIVSQMYQESKFNPQAKSSAGALGLMQVLPRTAKELGITDLHDPEQSVIAGIRYLDWTRDRFSRDLPIQEQIFFSLAAYNAGYGHVKDAQRLARQLGLRDDKWFNNVEKAMLLLQKRHYYSKARFGYVRGSEPVNYVYKIHQRYLGFVQATDLNQN